MRAVSLLSLLLLAPFVWAAEPSATLEGPSAGWGYAGRRDPSENPAGAYPTPPIDRGAQRNRTLIEGRLANIGHVRPPHRLVVNGNPLPLYTDDAGRFVRPYAFGAGSNSVEVVSGDGKSLKRVQFYEANTGRTPARLRV